MKTLPPVHKHESGFSLRRTLKSPWGIRLAGGAAVLGVAAVAVVLLRGSGAPASSAASYTVARKDLVISVIAGGTLISPGAKEITCRVEGGATIISVVPEGTLVTPEDVRNGMVLMELDSAALKERANQQDVTVQGASASFTQARESYGIQVNLNESNIKAGELEVKFAKMDLEKYLGSDLAASALAGKTDFVALCGADCTPEEIGAELEKLGIGGSARQTWRKFQAAIDLASEEVRRSETQYDWSRKLGPTEMGGAGYIPRTDVEADALALKRRHLEQEQARLDLQIYLKYEFPKEAERLISNHDESCRSLERDRAQARAEIAKAEADLKSKDATYRLQKDRLDKLNEQIAYCTIRATWPGRVVYPTPSTNNRGGSSDRIEEGSTVRVRQALLSVPDPTSMAVNAKVHEAMVSKVKAGQRARIILEGFADRELWGEVRSVAGMADPVNPWLSPDLKVYTAVIAIQDPPTDLKTGMGAKAEILIQTLPEVLAVPLQAVTAVNGSRFCYMREGGKTVPRLVQTGEFNDNFIEIQSGLSDGDVVLLHRPEDAAQAVEMAKQLGVEEAKPAAATEPAAPAVIGDPEVAPTETNAAATVEDEEKKPAVALGPEVEAAIARAPADRQQAMRERFAAMSADERTEALKLGAQRRRPRNDGESAGEQ